MRTVPAAVLALALTLPSSLTAEVVLRVQDHASPDRPAARSAAGADDGPGVIREPIDQPAVLLVVPSYEVETGDPSGTTTLYAVRNTTTSPIDLTIDYLSTLGAVVRQDLVTLGARQTLSRNIRDVVGLPVDPDGIARGIVRIQIDPVLGNILTGDFLQVDVGDNFATGDRMFSGTDFCQRVEIRFFDVGSGTDLKVLANIARGSDPMTDPPTVTVTPIGEDGAVFPPVEVYTDEVLNDFTAADFTTLDFGALIFDFSTSGGGNVIADYSAEGRFSVGMNAACLDP